ncbi:hypothetical protein MHU86_7681 [Fragilaria crotonensis]|nr:hypothetical protein MHU86_7681 [Fragilaria crotonensis]
MLVEELQASRFNDIGDRQKELHSEFHHLFNLVKEMANSGVNADSMRDDVATSSENETLRIDNASLKARCAETEAEIKRLRFELQNLATVQESLASLHENSSLELDRTDLGETRTRAVDGRGVINDFKLLENQLLEMTQRADFSEREVNELEERLELAKSTIMNLREIISKNNDTYITKVESLTDELNDLRRANESLHSHIHDLSVENRGLRHGDLIRDVGDEGQQRQLEDLRTRLNHVAGFLIALSLVLDEENASEGWFGDYERRELRDEVLRRQEDLLASDGRGEIVQVANDVGRELRSGPRRPRASLLSGQREEVNSISAELKNFR